MAVFRSGGRRPGRGCPGSHLQSAAIRDAVAAKFAPCSAAMTDSTCPLPHALVEAAEQEGRVAWLAALPGHRRPAGQVVVAQRGAALPAGRDRPRGSRRLVTGPARERVLKVGWAASGGRARGGRAAGMGRARCRPAARGRAHGRHDRAAARAVPTRHAARRAAGAGAGRGGRRSAAPAVDPHAADRIPRSARCATWSTQWAAEFEERVAAQRRTSSTPGWRRDGMALFRALPAEADRAVLLVTDLHAGNVLGAAAGAVAGHRPEAVRR